MTSTLKIPLKFDVTAEIHEIAGGGFWAEVPSFPGCVAQAETRDDLEGNIARAIADWLATSAEKTEAEVRELALIQGVEISLDEAAPQTYSYNPPASWSDDDE